MDVLVNGPFTQLLADAEAGHIAYGHFALPCSPDTCIRNIVEQTGEGRARRTRTEPDGRSGLSAHEAYLVRCESNLTLRCCAVASAIVRNGGEVSLEAPALRSDTARPDVCDTRAAEHSGTFQRAAIAELREAVGLQLVTTEMCAWAGEGEPVGSQKSLDWLLSQGLMPGLGKQLREQRCTHAHGEHAAAFGRGGGGAWRSAQSAAYRPNLIRAVATAVVALLPGFAAKAQAPTAPGVYVPAGPLQGELSSARPGMAGGSAVRGAEAWLPLRGALTGEWTTGLTRQHEAAHAGRERVRWQLGTGQLPAGLDEATAASMANLPLFARCEGSDLHWDRDDGEACQCSECVSGAALRLDDTLASCEAMAANDARQWACERARCDEAVALHGAELCAGHGTQEAASAITRGGQQMRLHEAKKHEMWPDFERAIETELDTVITEFQCLEPMLITDVPEGFKLFPSDIKCEVREADSVKPRRCKARLCFGGHREEHGVDYFNTHDPTPRICCPRLLFCVACSKGWALRHSDQRGAYMNAPVRPGPTIHVRLQPGLRRYEWVNGEKVEVVYRMRKAMYGQHESARQFGLHHRKWFVEQGFKASHLEPCLYYRSDERGTCMVTAYIDDGCWLFSSDKLRDEVEAEYKRAFKADFADLSRYLNVEVQYDRARGTLSTHQSGYIAAVAEQLLSKEELAAAPSRPAPEELERLCSKEAIDAQPVASPELIASYLQIVGVLMYLTNTTRVESANAVNKLSRACAKPSLEQLAMARGVLSFMYATKDRKATYDGKGEWKADAFSDSDWATTASTTGFVVMMCGAAVLYGSRRQKCTALSSAQAELVAASHTACEVVYWRELCRFLGVALEAPTPLHVDNSAAVAIATNPLTTSALKHVARRHFFVREMQEEGEVAVVHVGTARNLADICTKVLSPARFRELWGGISSGFGRVSTWLLESVAKLAEALSAFTGAAQGGT